MKKILILVLIIGALFFLGYRYAKKVNPNGAYQIGQPLDSLDGVKVYYNGGVDHVLERNVAEGGYNLGLKYQCVEFVKRYYYEHYQHKMPDSYGHAKDFFDHSLADGALNKQRNLIQFRNGSSAKPRQGDLIVIDGSAWNKYGHVAIISEVGDDYVEIIQQNPGPYGKSRETFKMEVAAGQHLIRLDKLLGWLRMKDKI